jgi:hypothetical protein
MFEPRLAHLADAGASQHAQPQDVGGATVLGRVQRLCQLADFLLGQEALARVLDTPMKA